MTPTTVLNARLTSSVVKLAKKMESVESKVTALAKKVASSDRDLQSVWNAVCTLFHSETLTLVTLLFLLTVQIGKQLGSIGAAAILSLDALTVLVDKLVKSGVIDGLSETEIRGSKISSGCFSFAFDRDEPKPKGP